jgi:hypothetical protein
VPGRSVLYALQFRCGRGHAGLEGAIGRVAEGERGIANRAIAGATAEIATERVRIDGAFAVWIVMLSEHADHEAGGAVAALRAAIFGHRGLRGREASIFGKRLEPWEET